MATTTVDMIRDRIRTVIEAIAPLTLTNDPFKRYRYEKSDDFRGWASENPQASVRRFHVRSTGADQPVEISNYDFETHYVVFEVVIAYPQTNRWGGDDALDRDDAMDQDRHLVEHVIGLSGAANFVPGTADAVYRGHVVTRETGGSCDFLVITQTMSFYRAMP